MLGSVSYAAVVGMQSRLQLDCVEWRSARLSQLSFPWMEGGSGGDLPLCCIALLSFSPAHCPLCGLEPALPSNAQHWSNSRVERCQSESLPRLVSAKESSASPPPSYQISPATQTVSAVAYLSQQKWGSQTGSVRVRGGNIVDAPLSEGRWRVWQASSGPSLSLFQLNSDSAPVFLQHSIASTDIASLQTAHALNALLNIRFTVSSISQQNASVLRQFLARCPPCDCRGRLDCCWKPPRCPGGHRVALSVGADGYSNR